MRQILQQLEIISNSSETIHQQIDPQNCETKCETTNIEMDKKQVEEKLMELKKLSDLYKRHRITKNMFKYDYTCSDQEMTESTSDSNLSCFESDSECSSTAEVQNFNDEPESFERLKHRCKAKQNE